MEKVPLLAALFVGFSIAASSVYLINDYMDRHEDRLHPTKRNRAIASGRLPLGVAVAAAFIFTVLSLLIGLLISIEAGALILLYLLVSHVYTFHLKHMSLVDVAIVGGLFGIRTFGGFLAVGLYPHFWWLWVILAGLIAFVIELGKRKCEVQTMGNSPTTRSTLSFYSNDTIARLFLVSFVLIFVVYIPASFAVAPIFAASVALVVPGIRRYWHLISIQTEDVHPQRLIFADTQIRLFVTGFAALFMLSTISI